MVVYVSHKINKNPKTLARAKKIVSRLEFKYPLDSFYCPEIALYHLIEKDVDADFLLEKQKDFMDLCDKMIVIGNLCNNIKRELDYADLIGMEVEWFEVERP